MGVKLLWALWIFSGGHVNGGGLLDAHVAAYFVTREECERVQGFVNQGLVDARGQRVTQCIQGAYVLLAERKAS